MRANLFNHLKRAMIIAMVAVRMMKASINQIVHVPFVLHGGVAASRGVNVRMVGVSGAGIFTHNY